jgi:hypothetical protein
MNHIKLKTSTANTQNWAQHFFLGLQRIRTWKFQHIYNFPAIYFLEVAIFSQNLFIVKSQA